MTPSIEPVFDSIIIVCCHGIWLGGPERGENESEWLIEPFQASETPTFIAHIKAGVAALAANDRAILVFSGGATKQSKTPLSEAESYLNLAIAQSFFGLEPSSTLRNRTFTDTNATDSFQNILFPLLQFPLFAHRASPTSTSTSFPRHLTLISHAFKRTRFLSLHLPALRWPTTTTTTDDRVTYIGIDPPFNETKMAEIRDGDRKRGYGAWKGDLYGAGDLLAGKRVSRGWTAEKEEAFERDVIARLAEGDQEAIMALLHWEGGATGTEIFPQKLPWE